MAGVTGVVVHRARPDACVRTGRLLAEQGVGRLIVVDNASPAADVTHVRAGLPGAEMVELGHNAGFGPAANVGLRRWLAEDGGGEWACVCPHDAVPEPGCLDRLVSATARRPTAGLASAEYGDAGRLAKPVVDRYFGGILASSDRRPGWEAAGHPHGTLLLARRSCLQDVGLFDERYFAYCEEADLGERARRAGWEVGIVWGAVVRNPDVSSEAGVAEYLMVRNSLLLVRSHFGRYPAFIRFTMATWTTLRGTLRPGRRTPFWDLPARWMALRDYALGRFGPPPASLACRSSFQDRNRTWEAPLGPVPSPEPSGNSLNVCCTDESSARSAM
jgi:N-acetylglucosaminyl-diphospho-decaprenol L-rhamnosyltransferase